MWYPHPSRPIYDVLGSMDHGQSDLSPKVFFRSGPDSPLQETDLNPYSVTLVQALAIRILRCTFRDP
jgi:hypothetical protein